MPAKDRRGASPQAKIMKTMSNEVRKELDGIFTKNAEVQESLSHVTSTSRTAILNAAKRGLSADAMLYATALRDEKQFFKRVIKHCPNVIYNGESEPTAVDFIEVKTSELDKYKTQFKSYRLSPNEEQVALESCSNCIYTTRVMPVMLTLTYKHESGYEEKIERQAKDKEGKGITAERNVVYVPRKKTIWGYTNVVKEAIYAALEELVNE